MSHEMISQVVGVWGSIYFLLLFIAVLFYALNPKSQDKFDHAAHIPLREDDLDD